MNLGMKYTGFHLIKRTIVEARPFWLSIIGYFLLQLLAIPIALLKPLPLKILIDSGFDSQPLPDFINVFFSSHYHHSFETIVLLSAAFVVLIAIMSYSYAFMAWMASIFLGEKMILHFRGKVFDHVQRLSLSYHDHKGTSDALYRIQSDASGLRTFLLNNCSSLISSFITMVVISVVMFQINWHFTLIALCVMPPLSFVLRKSTKQLRNGWKQVKESESKAMSVVHEVLNSLRVVKAFGQETLENDRFIQMSNEAKKGQVKMAKIGAGFDFLVGVMFALGTALFIYFGALFVKSGEMTLGELTLVIAYLSQIYGPLEKISNSLNSIQSSLTSIDRVFSLLDEETEVKEAEHPVHMSKLKDTIEFRNVSFHYKKEKPILSNVSFKIKAGDRVGIMGTTGAGKTTLVNLLSRLYDPASGEIIVDGKNVKDYKLSEYRNQFGVVLQEPILFSTTIEENIAYGRPGATKKEIMEAAKLANANDFIMRSADGYETLVGQRGMQLSGGERQRISIARAFVKDAPVLILDEPTSSLDIRTEAMIMEAMERLMKGRTTFLITHRLDTLKKCNIILHLEKGQLVEVINNTDPQLLVNKKISFLAGAAL